MSKPNLRIIKGGPGCLIEKATKKFISAFVTNTRLMGVLVLYVHWRIEHENDVRSLHQFFYIETTESGIESYSSIYGNDQKLLLETEQAMIGGLGGEKKYLTEKEIYMLLQMYAKMTEDFGEPLPEDMNEYLFMIKKEIDYDAAEGNRLFRKTCADIICPEQLINYFIMRYTSADYPAVDYLSYGSLKRDIIDASKTQTLCINKIEKKHDEGGNVYYICESLVEDHNDYRILITEIKIKNKLVAFFEKLTDFSISSAEAAMKLVRTEYITVFEIMDDREIVIEVLNEMYPTSLKKDSNMGDMYMLFKKNNDHINEAYYRLNDDIKGLVYVTHEDQLVIASYSLPAIHRLENELQYSGFGDLILVLAKYEFKESVFYDFLHSSTGDFLHYIEYVSDFNPEDE